MDDDAPRNQAFNAAWEFGRQCAEFKRNNPFEEVALDLMISTLMTELWDRDFSQSEIRAAFEQALSAMPKYAAGFEKRSDGPH